MSIAVVIPCFAETQALPNTVASLESSYSNIQTPSAAIHVVIVVNAPAWATQAQKKDNLSSLTWLNQYSGKIPITVLDQTKLPLQNGVGEARKIGMDHAATHLLRQDDDWIVSLDADTHVAPNYFSHILAQENSVHKAYTFGFLHPVGTSEQPDIGIGLYELYLRYLYQGLCYSGSPFAYHSVGSAFGLSRRSYLSSGGMVCKNATEDFHFLNKLRKLGPIHYCPHIKVFPAARSSDRVHLGTGYFVHQHENHASSAINNLMWPTKQHFFWLKELYQWFEQLRPNRNPALLPHQHLKQALLQTKFFQRFDQVFPQCKSIPQIQSQMRTCLDAIDVWRILRFWVENEKSKKISTMQQCIQEAANLVQVPNTRPLFELLQYYRTLEQL